MEPLKKEVINVITNLPDDARDPAAVAIRILPIPSKISFHGDQTKCGLMRAGSFARGSVVILY